MKRTFAAFILSVIVSAIGAQAQTNHYVWLSGGNISPYTNWATAARNINDAITTSVAGAVIWVTNGVYDSGGTLFDGLTNRVYISKAVRVQSVSGPAVTSIKGAWDSPSTTNGPAAVRCVYIIDNASLVGFTLTNGATRTGSGTETYACGGGALGASSAAVISNCVLTGNRAHRYGAGVRSCSLYDCMVVANVAAFNAGGVYVSFLYNCEIRNNTSISGSGGMFGTAAYACTFANNTGTFGGGAIYSSLYSCVITGNYASSQGGGVDSANAYNCTIVGNSAGSSGGGASRSSTIWNSIFYNNGAGGNYVAVTSYFSCTTPMPPGSDNITNEPMFVDRPGGNLRLDLGSPCVNAGTNFAWMSDPADARSSDADGQPRLRGPLVDMGAYEQYITPGTIFIIRGQ